MKKILLCLTVIFYSIFCCSQGSLTFPCPATYKSNSGGAQCTRNVAGCAELTASVTLTYTNLTPTEVPDIQSITDANGEQFIFSCSIEAFINPATRNEVRVCLYATAQSDNFFNKQRSLTIVLKYPSAASTQTCVVIPDNENIPTPVHFKSFNASRTTTSNVSIAWTTATEQNNKGFNVQKNVNGEWTTIAFIPSKAQGGNSTYDLSYSYKDVNQAKGITQYRVQQVDLDGKFSYTDIRAIRAEGTVGKTVVYPNPTSDGKLNVVFEDNTAIRDVYINDMQGKIIRSYKGITNNILVIERLTSGFYTIKITNRTTAATTVEKVVVK